MPVLKDKYRAFVDEYLGNGMQGYVAYMKIYDTKNTNTAKVNSHKILKRDDVKAYIKKRQDELSNKVLITREKQIERLEEIIEGYKKNRPYVVLQALQEENKLLGLYEPEETNNTIQILKTIKRTK